MKGSTVAANRKPPLKIAMTTKGSTISASQHQGALFVPLR